MRRSRMSGETSSSQAASSIGRHRSGAVVCVERNQHPPPTVAGRGNGKSHSWRGGTTKACRRRHGQRRRAGTSGASASAEATAATMRLCASMARSQPRMLSSGAREKGVGHLLEFRFRQIARGRAVVLVHGVAHLDRQPEGVGEDGRGLAGLGLGGEMMRRKPVRTGLAAKAAARARRPRTGPSPAPERRVHLDLRMAHIQEEVMAAPEMRARGGFPARQASDLRLGPGSGARAA